MKNSFNDIAGIGKIAKALATLLKYYVPNQNDKLDQEIKKEKIKAHKIKNFILLDNHVKKSIDKRIIKNLDP
jgi:5'(3')-deoxyribonucleotidase